MIRATAQDHVDTSTLHRNVGLGFASVGVVAAAIGGYLLITTPSDGPDSVAQRRRWISTGWADGHGGGVLLLGRF